jgi:hypothetical protein
MVHLAYGDRDAISVTSSALVHEDSARGKRVFGGFRAHHHLEYSVIPPFVVQNWILNAIFRRLDIL